MDRLAYRGHVIHAIPEQERDHWVAMVIIEVHSPGVKERIHYRDHTQSYVSVEDAKAASIEFGKKMIENFTIPAYGEGDYRDETTRDT